MKDKTKMKKGKEMKQDNGILVWAILALVVGSIGGYSVGNDIGISISEDKIDQLEKEVKSYKRLLKLIEDCASKDYCIYLTPDIDEKQWEEGFRWKLKYEGEEIGLHEFLLNLTYDIDPDIWFTPNKDSVIIEGVLGWEYKEKLK